MTHTHTHTHKSFFITVIQSQQRTSVTYHCNFNCRYKGPLCSRYTMLRFLHFCWKTSKIVVFPYRSTVWSPLPPTLQIYHHFMTSCCILGLQSSHSLIHLLAICIKEMSILKGICDSKHNTVLANKMERMRKNSIMPYKLHTPLFNHNVI
jgi:hypothetical protein